MLGLLLSGEHRLSSVFLRNVGNGFSTRFLFPSLLFITTFWSFLTLGEFCCGTDAFCDLGRIIRQNSNGLNHFFPNASNHLFSKRVRFNQMTSQCSLKRLGFIVLFRLPSSFIFCSPKNWIFYRKSNHSHLIIIFKFSTRECCLLPKVGHFHSRTTRNHNWWTGIFNNSPLSWAFDLFSVCIWSPPEPHHWRGSSQSADSSPIHSS